MNAYVYIIIRLHLLIFFFNFLFLFNRLNWKWMRGGFSSYTRGFGGKDTAGDDSHTQPRLKPYSSLWNYNSDTRAFLLRGFKTLGAPSLHVSTNSILPLAFFHFKFQLSTLTIHSNSMPTFLTPRHKIHDMLVSARIIWSWEIQSSHSFPS